MNAATQWLSRVPRISQVASWSRPVQLGVAAIAVALVVVAAMWLQQPSYKVLFSNLEDRDGGAIITSLGQMNVPYQLSDNGRAIMVPADRVHEVRLQLAQEGLPRSGTAGFELLDQTRFGASQFAEQVNYQRALEGELTNSIQALHAVQQARVHLAIPRESLFVRDRQPPTASVLVTLYPGRTLSEPQVSAITWLVSSSVPHLTPENVSVVDQNGRLLTSPTGEAGMDGDRRDIIHDIEQRTVQRILTLLNPLLGNGNVRAQVSAEVDFSQREQTSEVYRPNQTPGEAAVRSQQTSQALQNGVIPPQGIPGALTNQPPANPVAPIETPPANPNANQNANPNAQGQNGQNADGTNQEAPTGSLRNDATINYEVDRTISHVKDAAGRLQRLSVAVVVNHREVEGEFQPLPQEELDKLESLVRQAMGYSAERGDTITVVNSQFTPEPRPPIWEDPIYIGYATNFVKYALIAFGLYLLWRLILRRIVLETQAAQQRREAEMRLEQEAREQAQSAAKLAADLSRYEDNLKTARELAGRDPRAVAMVLRAWLEKKDAPTPPAKPER